MGDAPDHVRGLANRGTRSRLDQERNVPAGDVFTEVPGRNFNIRGFDIEGHSLEKAGIKEGLGRLDPAIHELATTDDRRPYVVITGHASDSPRPGRGRAVYAKARANSVKEYLMSKGVAEDRIRIKTDVSTPRTKPPREQSATEKAAERSATVEFKYSGEKRGTAPLSKYGDTVTYIKGEPGWEWPKLPKLGPILGGGEWGAGGEDQPPETRDRKKPPDDHRKLREFLEALLEGALKAGGLVLAGAVLPEILAAVALEYGEQKLEDYIKEQLEKQKKEARADTADRERFMREMLRRINADYKHHPLRGLVDPVTMNWIGRSLYPKGKGRRWTRLLDVLPAVQAGHLTSHHGGGRALALEDPMYNIFIKSSAEKLGVVFESVAVDIGGVPVEYITAKRYEAARAIPAGAVQKAPWSAGWTP